MPEFGAMRPDYTTTTTARDERTVHQEHARRSHRLTDPADRTLGCAQGIDGRTLETNRHHEESQRKLAASQPRPQNRHRPCQCTRAGLTEAHALQMLAADPMTARTKRRDTSASGTLRRLVPLACARRLCRRSSDHPCRCRPRTAYTRPCRSRSGTILACTSCTPSDRWPHRCTNQPHTPCSQYRTESSHHTRRIYLETPRPEPVSTSPMGTTLCSRCAHGD
jgi:hypothetical protein